MTGPDWMEYPGADSRSECFYTREAVPPIPGTPYVTTRNERYKDRDLRVLSTIILIIDKLLLSGTSPRMRRA